MRGPLRLRSLTSEEERVITKLARSQSASKRLVERVRDYSISQRGANDPPDYAAASYERTDGAQVVEAL